jgi:hypothetical protein
MGAYFMPQTLKSAPDGRVKLAEFYSVGELALLLGVGHSTAIRLIDGGQIRGFRQPGVRRDRLILHQALVGFVRRNRDFSYVFDKIDGFNAVDDIAEASEPPPPPARSVRSAAPRSAHRPRSVVRGKLPVKLAYSPSEVAFALGLARRTINSWLDAGIIRGFKVSSQGLTKWTWKIARGPLVEFLRRNPQYAYAWDRLGIENGGS